MISYRRSFFRIKGRSVPSKRGRGGFFVLAYARNVFYNGEEEKHGGGLCLSSFIQIIM